MKVPTQLLFVLVFAGVCVADYTPQYDSYWTFSFDPETSTASLNVIVDGTTTGDCYIGTYYISNCPAQHSPGIENVINSTNASSNGPSQDMFSYMSYEIDNSAALPVGTDYYTFQIEATIYCATAGANIYDTGYVSGSHGSPDDIPLNQFSGQCYTNYNSSNITAAHAYWNNTSRTPGCWWDAPENESYPTWVCTDSNVNAVPTCLQTNTNKRCAYQQIFVNSACNAVTSNMWRNTPR